MQCCKNLLKSDAIFSCVVSVSNASDIIHVFIYTYKPIHAISFLNFMFCSQLAYIIRKFIQLERNNCGSYKAERIPCSLWVDKLTIIKRLTV